MKISKKIINGAVVAVALVAVAFASNSLANSLTVVNYNNTTQSWNGRDCVAKPGTAGSCKSFTLNSSPVFETLTTPSSGTATLSGSFVDLSSGTTPVNCSSSFNVNLASYAVINVNQSSATYNCSIYIH